MTFENFKNIIRNGEAKGEIKTSKPLTDFDLAVQWAIGNIGKRKGYPCDITIDEIWQEIYPIYEADAQEVADFLNGCTEHAKQADTPQTECRTCKWAETSWTSHYCDDCKAHNKYEPNDTPQTDCSTCKFDDAEWYVNNCDECVCGNGKPSNYVPKQTDCPWK